MDAAARSLNLLDLEGIGKDSVGAAANASPAVAVDLRLVAERAAFDALENEWNDLFARAGKPTHVFQSFNFCWHWANHYLTSSPDDGNGHQAFNRHGTAQRPPRHALAACLSAHAGRQADLLDGRTRQPVWRRARR